MKKPSVSKSQQQQKPKPKKVHQIQPAQLATGNVTELFGKDKWKNLFAPVDSSSVVFYRILFGTIMLYEVAHYLSNDLIGRYWLRPTHHFTYYPFDFLAPLPGEGMYYLFYFMAILSICIIVGLFYRVAMFLFWICFSYTFLLEQTRYLNHFYLIVLVCFVMIFIPANSSASVDNKFFKKTYSESIPLWSLWLMRFMIGVPYFFGGVAKINSDWLQGQPLIMWLQDRQNLPSLVVELFKHDWVCIFMAYSGMFLDLFIVPALLFKRTRVIGFLMIVSFHLMNSQLFDIGIFPWFMIAATSLFFEPDWFRKVIIFFTGNAWQIHKENSNPYLNIETFSVKQKLIVASLIIWVSVQVLLPFRHLLVPGSVHWTEEGHRYSWHMKLRTKRGIGTYTVKDKKTGETEIINEKDYLNKRQRTKMSGKPYLIWQFCQMIKKDYAAKGKDVAVYANIKATLNGRKYQQLIDSTVDLTSVARPIFPASWIIPLHTPLSDKLERFSENGNSEEGGE